MATFGVFVKTSKEGKFLDFVVTDKASANVRRVNMTQINTFRKGLRKTEQDILDSSLRVAMLDLDYRARNGYPINRNWKKVAEKVHGVSRIGV